MVHMLIDECEKYINSRHLYNHCLFWFYQTNTFLLLHLFAMPYNVDRIVNEIRNYNRTVNVMRSEFEAWKNEIQQQMTELKLMIERNNFINYPLPQGKKKRK